MNSEVSTDFVFQNSLYFSEHKKNILQYIIFIFNERLSHWRQTFLNRMLKFNLEVDEKNVLTLKLYY